MGISTTPLYKCDSCNETSSNPYYFRIIEGRVAMGSQTLVNGYKEVLCIECFCIAMGIGHDMDDNFRDDKRFQHIEPSYTGDQKDVDTFYKDDGEEKDED